MERLTNMKKEQQEKLLHNFGPIDPIPIGAVAICGEVSTYEGSGEQNPLRTKCCPICLALVEVNLDNPDTV